MNSCKYIGSGKLLTFCCVKICEFPPVRAVPVCPRHHGCDRLCCQSMPWKTDEQRQYIGLDGCSKLFNHFDSQNRPMYGPPRHLLKYRGRRCPQYLATDGQLWHFAAREPHIPHDLLTNVSWGCCLEAQDGLQIRAQIVDLEYPTHRRAHS